MFRIERKAYYDYVEYYSLDINEQLLKNVNDELIEHTPDKLTITMEQLIEIAGDKHYEKPDDDYLNVERDFIYGYNNKIYKYSLGEYVSDLINDWLWESIDDSETLDCYDSYTEVKEYKDYEEN